MFTAALLLSLTEEEGIKLSEPNGKGSVSKTATGI
jgi:hypothetical protein